MQPAPLLLGFVLGPLMEENLRRALLISRGDATVFLTRPISLGFMIATAHHPDHGAARDQIEARSTYGRAVAEKSARRATTPCPAPVRRARLWTGGAASRVAPSDAFHLRRDRCGGHNAGRIMRTGLGVWSGSVHSKKSVRGRRWHPDTDMPRPHDASRHCSAVPAPPRDLRSLPFTRIPGAQNPSQVILVRFPCEIRGLEAGVARKASHIHDAAVPIGVPDICLLRRTGFAKAEVRERCRERFAPARDRLDPDDS